MKRRFNPWGVLWLLLIGALAGCVAMRAESTSSTPVPTPEVPGLDRVGPLSQYQLWLELDPVDKRLRGREQVTFCNETGVYLEELVFRLYPNLPRYGTRMGIGPVWVNDERTSSRLRADNTSLVVPLARRLAPKGSATISMTFDIEIPERDSGYVLFGHSQGIWSVPDGYPLLAVHDGERWHDDIAPPQADPVFASVALYDVTLTLPPTLTLTATGTPVSTQTDSSGQRVHHITGGPLREFAWLASADYRKGETSVGGVRVRSLYLPGDETAGQAALNAAAAALRVYSESFGSYPFPEMVVAEAPLGYFGMEYPGLNLIGEELYRGRRDELEIRVVHEVAHQWWYSQVGSDQVNAPWLDEGLAEYSTATYYAQVYGQERANALLNQRWLAPYQALVEDGQDAVVGQPASAFGPEYEVIVYAKAALFFDSVRQELGEEMYQAVLGEYLNRYRWSIATPDDLMDVAQAVSGKDLGALYNRWILSAGQ